MCRLVWGGIIFRNETLQRERESLVGHQNDGSEYPDAKEASAGRDLRQGQDRASPVTYLLQSQRARERCACLNGQSMCLKVSVQPWLPNSSCLAIVASVETTLPSQQNRGKLTCQNWPSISGEPWSQTPILGTSSCHGRESTRMKDAGRNRSSNHHLGIKRGY